MSNFIVQALKGEPITIYGDGSQTRSFCYSEDLVLGVFRMMNSLEDLVGPVNLGNQAEFTILELANMILSITGSKSKLQFKQLPMDDPKQRRPDISLARSKLEWSPSISLDLGLARTVEYFEKII